MNSLNIVGRVAQEIEVKEVGKNNTKMVKNALAVVDNYNRENTNFIQFTIFGKSAENFEKVVDKGDLVGLANAELKVDQYENEDGDKRSYTYALANNWQLYRKKKDSKQNNTVKEEVEQSKNVSDDTDYDDENLPY